jgi:iron complex transport system permease protein
MLPLKRGARLALLIACVALLVVTAGTALRVGAADMTWQEFFHAYFHYTGTDDDIIVRGLRGPRMFISVEVGAALATAGAVIQGLTRNPLADPGILGINAGAALFVVLGIGVFGAAQADQYVWFAFPGALLAALVAFVLAAVGRGRPTPLKLTLAGVITAALCGALTEAVTFLSPAVANDYRFWAVGDVGGRDMSVVDAVTPPIVIGLLLAMPIARALNGLSLGEEVARSLGQRVALTRFVAVAAVILLAGGSVAAAGPIAFVGLAVPNAVRALVGNDYRWILPLSGVLGAVFVLAADIVARTIVRPAEIETGLVIEAIGAPVFLFLVSRRRLPGL